MNKIYRGVIRLLQRINYFVYKQYCVNKSNILSELEFDLERLPDNLVKGMSRGLRINKQFPAGKSIFIDVVSEELTIEVLYNFRRILDNMDNQGTSGIDVYILNEDGGYIWKETLAPAKTYQMYVKRVIRLNDGNNKLRFFMPSFAVVEGIFFTSYNSLTAELDGRADIVAYGSSITHGCAASRSGLNYLNQISNILGCGILNYGFSESAKGEEELLKYISLMPLKVLIMEYDHNASVDELEKTHRRAYETIRRNFKGWIIMLSRFSGGLSIPIDEEKKRIRIIQNTFEYAKRIGDQRTVFYNGSELFKEKKEYYFVDNVHPNDEGMTAIAKMLCTLIQKEGMLK